jgi:uncharacterized RDD family membrane protein YckC
MEGMMDKTLARRIVALLIDLLLISVVYTIAINVVPEGPPVVDSIHNGWSIPWPGYLYAVVLGIYYVGCDLINRGESLGKDMMRLRTTDPKGERLKPRAALVRTFLKLISIGMLPIALILFLWKSRGFTLQDYLTGTSVKWEQSNEIA